MRANRLRAAVRPSIIGPPRLPALPDLTRWRRRHFAGVPVGLLVHVRPTPATSTAFPRVLPPGPRTASLRRSTLANTCDSWLLHSNTGANGRGRDEDCSSPPHRSQRALLTHWAPPSTTSAGSCLPLFDRFRGTMASSDFSSANMLGVRFAAKHDACVVLIGSRRCPPLRPFAPSTRSPRKS